MGGRIAVESAPGAGATFGFTIALPRAATDATPAFAPPRLSDSAVLIVAPGAIEAPLVAARLERWGATVALAPDARSASALLPERHWDAVLVDHALGLEAARAVLTATPGVERRIALVTPAERHELPALKALGFTGYLVKPVRTASLAARLGGEAANGEGAADEADIAPASAAAKGLAILIAEDNDINALLARALLTRLGHRPTIAPNGAAAVESCLAAVRAGAPYDLILMDVHMPEVDGIEATRRIRAAEAQGATPRTRIIALTANAFGEDRDACRAAGMDDFLVKPLDRERLLKALAGAGRAAIAA
jgi:CheY-like chemotaxis protein